MPSLNMCGFLYSGADLGGFGSNATEDLLLRWLSFGVFTPLMRNHSCDGTRLQEFFRFSHIERFRSIINVRYRLIPYIYSEYMKAVLTDDILFKPLAFEYTKDEIASSIEDELMFGNEILLTPVYTQNAKGRLVYLPEDMMLLRFCKDGSIETKQYQKGTYYISVPLDEVVLFIRSGKCIPIASPAETTSEIDYSSIVMQGYPDSSYELYNDDGFSKDYENPAHRVTLLL